LKEAVQHVPLGSGKLRVQIGEANKQGALIMLLYRVGAGLVVLRGVFFGAILADRSIARGACPIRDGCAFAAFRFFVDKVRRMISFWDFHGFVLSFRETLVPSTKTGLGYSLFFV
jgi:hypothetical protein